MLKAAKTTKAVCAHLECCAQLRLLLLRGHRALHAAGDVELRPPGWTPTRRAQPAAGQRPGEAGGGPVVLPPEHRQVRASPSDGRGLSCEEGPPGPTGG